MTLNSAVQSMPTGSSATPDSCDAAVSPSPTTAVCKHHSHSTWGVNYVRRMEDVALPAFVSFMCNTQDPIRQISGCISNGKSSLLTAAISQRQMLASLMSTAVVWLLLECLLCRSHAAWIVGMNEGRME